MRLELALRLRDSGLSWDPARGDRFVVPTEGLEDEVFVISDLTVEVHDVPSGRVVGFNGTTEWALDSLTLAQVVWLPREDQLRELLGERFARLESRDGSWAGVLTGAGGEVEVVDDDAESAYAHAVLRVRGAG